jgi:hypothetical protein
MINSQDAIRPRRIHSLAKWVWESDFRGPLIGTFGTLMAIVAGLIGILTISLANSTDVQFFQYIARAVLTLCYVLIGCGALLFLFAFLLTASSIGKQLVGTVSLFTTKRD